MSKVEDSIRQKLRERFQPEYLEVINESHMHSVPPNSETHFKVVLVSSHFSGKRSVQRHQSVYALLTEELQSPVHALALHTYTVDEWSASGRAPDSPQCLGGSKSD